MEWLSNLGGALAQGLVQSPVWWQMTVLILVAVPVAVAAAWCFMWFIDAVWRLLRRGD